MCSCFDLDLKSENCTVLVKALASFSVPQTCCVVCVRTVIHNKNRTGVKTLELFSVRMRVSNSVSAKLSGDARIQLWLGFIRFQRIRFRPELMNITKKSW
jgi:hypothetical protein